MPAIGYYNGTVGLLDRMQIPMNDRAVYFGDGCYEACFAQNGRLCFADAHLDRFYRSLEALRIPFSMTREQLLSEIGRCLAAADEPDVSLYWQVTRGTDRRHHTFPDGEILPNLLITATPKPVRLDDAPMRLVTAPDVRYRLCHIKTLNLIPNILAIQNAKDAGADEAVFVRDGFVTEGSHTNIHMLKDGVLYSHPADECILPGVTRGVLLKLCMRLGIPVSEKPFTVEQMRSADEVLISSSLLGVRTASAIDGAPVGGKAAETVGAIRDAYRNAFLKEFLR